MAKYLLAIDQGTTSTRAIVFDTELNIVTSSQKEFTQIFPAPGHVEHDPEEIWQTTLTTIRNAIEKSGLQARQIAAIGITNQRETTVIWDKKTGKPVYNAIVWQDRRTAAYCVALKNEGHEKIIREKTGLLLDPYFSATKIAWLLDNVSGARSAAQNGELLFGTIDSFLLWRLTGGRSHKTDATNASRTMLYNIHSGTWDDELLSLFNIPRCILPEVHDCAADFGLTDKNLFGASIPILGMAGDQQAATIGQGCFQPGMMKSTYGTGCFALLNTGDKAILSQHKLLTTLAYQLDGKPTYALEGSIFMAGATVQWLRDKLKIISHARDADSLAKNASPSENVYLVPAFVGLGAPWWDADARGTIQGLTRNSGVEEIAKAALEAVGYQTRDLIEAMRADWPENHQTLLRVDGGMTASNYAMQFLSDIINAPVERSAILETTALGAAYLAGKQAGICAGLNEFGKSLHRDKCFKPSMDDGIRKEKWNGWKNAVARTLIKL